MSLSVAKAAKAGVDGSDKMVRYALVPGHARNANKNQAA
jgi:hypothetical protein